MAHQPHNDGEVELKFELNGSAAKQVRRHALLSQTDSQTRPQKSLYFDTRNRKVREAGYSLRVRRDADGITQTVKTSGRSVGLFERGEWEAPVTRMAPDARALQQTPLRKLGKLGRNLEPVAYASVKRSAWLTKRDDSVIEAVLDSGTVRADGRKARFHELELELKAGEPAALFAFARELSQSAPLRIGVLSKEQRGLLLADGTRDHARKAAEPEIDKSMDAGQALVPIVHECIRHFRLNESLISERHPDALHQARVALRRLRTAFSLFRPAIRQGSVEPLRAELREFLRPLGEARNLDVFLDSRGHDQARVDRRKLKSARSKAYDQVMEKLEAQQSRAMFLDLLEWTIAGDWRKKSAHTPISRFAAERLDALWVKAEQRAAELSDLGEKELHRLRINIKKLRYATGFLAPLYSAKPVRKFQSSLEELQDFLGLIHDETVSLEIVAAYGLRELPRIDATARARQLHVTGKLFRKVQRAGPFWAP